jgi:transposase
MRRPAQIEPHLDTDELVQWVRESNSRDSYKKRLAIWLTHIGPFHAKQISTMLQVSVQSVWLWVSQYNRYGPDGLERKGRGGRRWSYISWAAEESLLRSFFERASRGGIITAKQMHPEVCKAVGKEVSLDYVYRMLYRHSWRKVGPRPRHIKTDVNVQDDFKKNSPLSSKKR